MTEFNTGFYSSYVDLLGFLVDSPYEETNERTGHKIRMLRGAFGFSVELGCNKLPVPGVRRVFPASAAAEVAWFLLGTPDPGFINRHAPLWKKFVEADGTIPAAYGYRWRRHFGRDQLALAVDRLAANPSDRQLVVSAWDPGSDAMGTTSLKNVPCPVMFTLSSTPRVDFTWGREVHATVLIRSSDCFVGLPYDVMGYCLLIKLIVSELRSREVAGTRGDCEFVSWRPGCVHFTLAHPHLYDSHFDMAREALASAHVVDEPELPPPEWTIGQVERRPNDYVSAVRALVLSSKQPEFNPQPEVIE
jgi:thymidylate synthase